ncbi:hypothetical protein AALA98_14605 [Lachnospiraceae bacterium 45-W7]
MILFLIILILLIAILYLTSGKTNQKTENRTIHTSRNVQEIANLLRQIANEMRANVDKIEDDPFGKFGSSEDLAIMLSGEERGLSRDVWAVQVYVTTTTNGCDVELVAIGEGLSAGYSGTYYHGRIKLASSRKRINIIAARL